MNEMYSMGLSIHSYGAVALLGVIFLNIIFLLRAKELIKYKRMMSVFLMPFNATIIGLAIFTGVIMMAAKHLDFTIENIVMIFISIALIVLEAKRSKTLKYLRQDREDAIALYRPFGLRILYIEFLLVLFISIWMWVI
jgi:hypothetical protein